MDSPSPTSIDWSSHSFRKNLLFNVKSTSNQGGSSSLEPLADRDATYLSYKHKMTLIRVTVWTLASLPSALSILLDDSYVTAWTLIVMWFAIATHNTTYGKHEHYSMIIREQIWFVVVLMVCGVQIPCLGDIINEGWAEGPSTTSPPFISPSCLLAHTLHVR